jgi:uncharacterized protein (DUF433 family)
VRDRGDHRHACGLVRRRAGDEGGASSRRPSRDHRTLIPVGSGGVAVADSSPLELIVSDPQVVHGQAVIRGSRVPVGAVLDCLGDGMSSVEVLAEYPSATHAGIRGAVVGAAQVARER